MMPVYLSPLANHLWQSTIFAAAVVLLTLVLSKNRAQARYWLWLAASVKFLVPFSLLVAAGSLFEWPAAPAVAPSLSLAMEQISQPFAPSPIPALATQAAPRLAPALLAAVWFCGCAGVLLVWWARWRRIRAALR